MSDRLPHDSTDRQGHDKVYFAPDWRTLGARIRRAARVATVMHLVERRDDGNGKATLETSPGKSSG
ncbi:MAG: hypothetical protein MI923_03845 [Phycisphaerales bacterium]|nr:hypothetical protein [Phycisphaerales bacterium]